MVFSLMVWLRSNVAILSQKKSGALLSSCMRVKHVLHLSMCVLSAVSVSLLNTFMIGLDVYPEEMQHWCIHKHNSIYTVDTNTQWGVCLSSCDYVKGNHRQERTCGPSFVCRQNTQAKPQMSLRRRPAENFFQFQNQTEDPSNERKPSSRAHWDDAKMKKRKMWSMISNTHEIKVR